MRIGKIPLFAIFLIGALLNFPLAKGASPSTNPPTDAGTDLASVVDEFLRAHAAENPAWRREVRLGEATAAAPAPEGFAKGYSDTAGWFYYRVQNSDNLAPSARREIFRDPRFLAFLSALRDHTDNQRVRAVNLPRTSPDPLSRAEVLARLRAGNPAGPEVVNFTLGAAELISEQPVIITIAAKEPTS